jgi:hypothetical protein
MTNLEKLVERGFLKNNEEVYLEYGEYYFSGRIDEFGKYLVVGDLKFTSLSSAAVYLIQGLPENRWSSNHTNGWKRWKTWNSVFLYELRKK